MARLPRLVVPHQPHHVLQSGNDRQPIFRDTDDHVAFMGWLRESARQFKVAIHAYVLLPDRFQLLATPSDNAGLGRMMQWLGRHYVPYFNAKYQRTGTLWQGRYKATVLESDRYLLVCSRYIELGAVRAEIARGPEEHLWSSYSHHVGGKLDPLVTDHSIYWALGNTPFDREAAYRNLMEQGLSVDEIAALDDATRKEWPLGSDKFKALLAKKINRRVMPAKPGRPRKLMPKRGSGATS
jgi:putative transposase